MDYLKDIEKIIEWYEGLGFDYSNIDTLLYTRKKLSAHLYYLASIVGECKKKEAQAEHIRRSEYASAKIKHMATETAAKASELAEVDIKKHRKAEAEAHANYISIRLIYSAAENVNDALSQHISHLKQQLTQTKKDT